MRKPRDLDGELKALHDKARELKTRKVEQLGELVIATGADSLNADELADALIVLAATKDTAMKEAWAKRGAALQSRGRRTAPATERDTGGVRAQPSTSRRRGVMCARRRSSGANARGILSNSVASSSKPVSWT